MPCAAGGDTDSDTDSDSDADADSDTDTDTDTGTVSPPTLGYTVAYTGSGVGDTIVYDADGSELKSWHNYPETAGPVAYDASTDTAFVFQGADLVELDSNGSYQTGNTGYGSTFDADAEDGQVWVLFGTELLIYDESAGSASYPFNNSLVDARGVAVKNGEAYVVDNNKAADGSGNAGPDLYKCDTRGNCSLLYQDFDTSSARGRNVFFGPDDEPYGCTGAGAVYSIRSLSSGVTTPAAFFDGISLTDVSDCGWDEGSSEYLLYSPSNGVIRMREDSSGGVVTPTPSTYAGARAQF